MIGPMSDKRIRELCTGDKPMIEPFVDENVREISGASTGNYRFAKKVISYGLSSYGYDMRLATDFKIVTSLYAGIIDPKNIDALHMHEEHSEDYIIIPPNAFALAHTVEYWRIPRNVVGIVLGKSTYARCGLIANVTALEPGWEGHLTIELSNSAPLPLKVYVGEGIAQCILFEASEECEVSYADKQGKYQAQTGITLPRL